MKCPLCQYGEIVARKGKFGSFLGCSRYPTCAFTKPMKSDSEKSDLDRYADKLLRNHGFNPDRCY